MTVVNRFSSRKFWALPILVWMLLIAVSLFWNFSSLRQNTLKIFIHEAQTLAHVAQSTIMWTVQHERVYVPLTEWIPLEPFFAELPDRELVAADGSRFTRVSHALISRQMAEYAVLQGWDQKAVRMTSLQPQNPVNAPDAWERSALKSFKDGQAEKFALIGEGSDALLKYMIPLRAKPECLKCHAGFREGDLLGGLSVTEPAAARLALMKAQIVSISVTHAAIFVIVAIVLFVLLSLLKRQWLSINRINNEQEKMIVKLAESETRLQEMAVTDELTGLKNRRGFFLLAEQQIKSANRQKVKIWFIFIDVDGMKLVNDQYGHSEGDKTLTATANILRDTFRESDIVARIGGDEFAVIITSADEINSCAVIDRLQKNLGSYNAAVKNPCTLSLSAGLVCYDPCENTYNVEDLLKKADKLMYENKRNKKCRQFLN